MPPQEGKSERTSHYGALWLLLQDPDLRIAIASYEQETARRALRRSGLLEERRAGMPARLWFRVCPDAVWHALQASAGLSCR